MGKTPQQKGENHMYPHDTRGMHACDGMTQAASGLRHRDLKRVG